MYRASFDGEPAAQQPGARAAASVAQAAMPVERSSREDFLQVGGGSGRGVTHPVTVSRGQEHEVARGQVDLAGFTVDLDPAAARGDDMEGGIAVCLDSEAPGCAHQRPAVDGAADPDHAQ